MSGRGHVINLLPAPPLVVSITLNVGKKVTV